MIPSCTCFYCWKSSHNELMSTLAHVSSHLLNIYENKQTTEPKTNKQAKDSSFHPHQLSSIQMQGFCLSNQIVSIWISSLQLCYHEQSQWENGAEKCIPFDSIMYWVWYPMNYLTSEALFAFSSVKWGWEEVHVMGLAEKLAHREAPIKQCYYYCYSGNLSSCPCPSMSPTWFPRRVPSLRSLLNSVHINIYWHLPCVRPCLRFWEHSAGWDRMIILKASQSGRGYREETATQSSWENWAQACHCLRFGGIEEPKLARTIQRHRYLCTETLSLSLCSQCFVWKDVTQAPSSACNTLCAMSLETELPRRAQAQESVFPATSRTGSRKRCQGLNMEIFSFPFQVLILGIESTISCSRARGHFKLSQTLSSAFLKERCAEFVFPGSYLLGSEGLPPYTRTTLFSQVLFFPWPGPEDRSQRDPAHSAGYFSEDTKSLLPIALHLPQEIQVTQQKRGSMSDILERALPVSRAGKHIKVHLAERSHCYSINVYWASTSVPGPGLSPRDTASSSRRS